MMKMKLAIVMVGCLLSGVAVAAPKYDLNNDGTVDTQEKATRRADIQHKKAAVKQKMLVQFDVNKDGKLDKTERTTMQGELATIAFKRLDTDGNGQLSLAEFKQGKKFLKKHRAARGMKRGALKVR